MVADRFRVLSPPHHDAPHRGNKQRGSVAFEEGRPQHAQRAAYEEGRAAQNLRADCFRGSPIPQASHAPPPPEVIHARVHSTNRSPPPSCKRQTHLRSTALANQPPWTRGAGLASSPFSCSWQQPMPFSPQMRGGLRPGGPRSDIDGGQRAAKVSSLRPQTARIGCKTCSGGRVAGECWLGRG